MSARSEPTDIPSAGDDPVPASPRRGIAAAAALLVLAALAAYSNSFSGPYVYDDTQSIPENSTLLHLWPPWEALSPPSGGATVSGRPVLNYTFAVNYALGGTSVQGYHAANLVIHLLAGLVLFGLVRRTLRQPGLRGRFGAAALPLAFLVAALWTLHPLQTEAVSYLAQRAESLMGLFYLLTMYGFIRGVQSDRPWPFYLLSAAACALGMGTKEVMVSAPLMVLLFDRTFAAGTFRTAWRRRRTYYLTLAATWIPLGLLVGGNGNRGGSIGFGISVSWWEHALTQFEAVTRYLLLSAWPHPLVFDYGPTWVRGAAGILPSAAVVVALVAGTGYALWRRPALGFFGAWFLAILAPTSLLPTATQMIVEHRMYLPLAAVMALVVPGLYALGGRPCLAGLLAAAIALGGLTFRRNSDYRSPLALWRDTVVKRPDNAIAHCSLGAALSAADRQPEAAAEFETTLRLQPNNAEAHTNLGEMLSAAGRPDEAMPHLLAALRGAPDSASVYLNLGAALDRVGRTDEAVRHYEHALRIDPLLADAYNDLGNVLLRRGDVPAAIQQIGEALRLRPDYADAHYNLASALAKSGRMPEAETEFEAGRRLKPNNAVARRSWGNALAAAGRLPEAFAEFDTSLRLKPDDPDTHYDYGNALAAARRFEEAIGQYTEALRLRPDYSEAHNNLANTFTALGRNAEALPHYQAAFRLKPGDARVGNNLGLAFARLGRMREAAAQFAAIVQLDPNYQDARDNLASAQAELRNGAPKN